MNRDQVKTVADAIDYAVERVIEQGEIAKNEEERCCYRSPDGAKCAAGWLIDDEYYSDRFEGQILDEEHLEAIESSLGFPLDLQIARSLQDCHDMSRDVARFVDRVESERRHSWRFAIAYSQRDGKPQRLWPYHDFNRAWIVRKLGELASFSHYDVKSGRDIFSGDDWTIVLMRDADDN